MNLLSWTHVLLNWPEETKDKSLKDKFKTRVPEFNQFPGMLNRTWNSRSVSVNECFIGSQVSQDRKYQFTFSYSSKGTLFVVGPLIWVFFTCSYSVLYRPFKNIKINNKVLIQYVFSFSSMLFRNIFNEKLSIHILLLLFFISLRNSSSNLYPF